MDLGVQIGLVKCQGRLNGAAPELHVHLLHSQQPPLKTHQIEPTEIGEILRTLLH